MARKSHPSDGADIGGTSKLRKPQNFRIRLSWQKASAGGRHQPAWEEIRSFLEPSCVAAIHSRLWYHRSCKSKPTFWYSLWRFPKMFHRQIIIENGRPSTYTGSRVILKTSALTVDSICRVCYRQCRSWTVLMVNKSTYPSTKYDIARTASHSSITEQRAFQISRFTKQERKPIWWPPRNLSYFEGAFWMGRIKWLLSG